MTTQYIGAVYEHGEDTGAKKIQGWGQTAGAVDIDLWLEAIDKGETHINRATIKKARFGRELNGAQFDDLTYTRLMALLGV